MPRKNSVGDGGSAAQKRALGALPDAVRENRLAGNHIEGINQYEIADL